MTKNEQNTVIWPFNLLLWVDPINVSEQAPRIYCIVSHSRDIAIFLLNSALEWN